MKENEGLAYLRKSMGSRPSPRHSVDRYPDPHGSYVPGNVRWADDREQQSNRRKLTTPWNNGTPPEANKEALKRLFEKYTGAQIAEICGISRQGVWKWDEVPARMVKRLSEATGIKPEKLHPIPFY